MKDLQGRKNPNYKHGLTKTHLFQTWCNARSRCRDINCKPYKHYGGRGIKVCAEWDNDFKAFYDWAMANGYKEGLTLDRIDNNGNYEPSNCRWITVKEQSNNRRSNRLLSFRGETKTVSQWAEVIGMSRDTLHHRLASGWDVERALTTPKQVHVKKRGA